MRSARRSRSIQSSSGGATCFRLAGGPWPAFRPSHRSERRRSSTSSSSIRSGVIEPRRRRVRRQESSSAQASLASPRTMARGGDCSLGSVQIDADGKITIHCDAVEMGNGVGTAAANRVAAYLGGVADEVAVARVDVFGPLGLVTSFDPYTISQENQDAEARNPRWVPAISSATSASIGAHVGTHAAAEAARVIFRFGLWPAALELWGLAPTDLKALEWQRAHWRNGHLVMSGLAPLPLSALAATAHARQ